MVRPTPNVWFAANFPDDAIYDDDGFEVQFAGQNVAKAIGEILTAYGYRMEEPENEEHRGWSMNAYRNGRRFWMLVSAVDDFILQTRDMTWRLWPDRAAFREFLSHLHEGLSADPRFSRLRWWVKEWPPDEGESFPTPFDR